MLVVLLVIAVPISLVALYGINRTARSAEREIGGHFTTIAHATADAISDSIHSTVVDITLIAANPAVLDVLVAANRSYRGMSDIAISAKMQKGDEVWNKGEGKPLVDRVLSNRASRELRRMLQRDPKFLRITVIDEQGATVAATHKTSDYFQGDEEDWRSIYAEGRSVISILDIEHDPATGINFIGIGVPILEEDSAQSIGALHAMIDIASITPLLERADVGPRGRVILVSGDGRIVSGPNISFSANVRSDGYVSVFDALGVLRSRQTGYIVSEVRDQGETLIGFADTGLKEDYSNLSWAVLVSQPAAEAFAIIRTPELIIILMAFLGLGAVVAVGVFFAQRP